MKCTIPEISWHNREPVLSIDIQPNFNEQFHRLASGGSDCHVLIWCLRTVDEHVSIEVVSDLTRHQRAVNAVRWSPSGQYLASGDDDANIIIWYLKTDNIPLLEGETNDKETWMVLKILRGHKEDVYDISWSPDSLKLLSGSIDNTAIIWDLSKGKNDVILTDPKGFVQGVTWDPKGEYIAALGSDRLCRVYNTTGKQVISRTCKGFIPVPESHALHNKEVKYFHDDTFKSYFRRLSFSPDGNLLITPSGSIESEDHDRALQATYIFTLDCLSQPVAVLPSPKQFTIAVRCCPILFELHSNGPEPVIDLPYRMIFAVATDSDVILYDTQQLAPFAHFQKIHYTRLTDLAWSSDGRILAASSTDGFCTLISFEPNELGTQYLKEDSEPEESLVDISGCEELDESLPKPSISDGKNKENVEVKLKRPNILEKWAVKTPKKPKLDSSLKEDGKSEEIIEIDDNPDIRSLNGVAKESSASKNSKTAKPITPRRKPRTLEGSKSNVLLNFLKTTEIAEKADTGSIMILDENEARDAWKCDTESAEANLVKETPQSVDLTNDCTEEFHLYIEDSTLSQLDADEKQGTDGQCETKKDSNQERRASAVVKENQISTRSKSEAKETVGELKNVESNSESCEAIENCDTNQDVHQGKSVEKENKIDRNVETAIKKQIIDQKVHRRIPLITLASPKTKKKKEDKDA